MRIGSRKKKYGAKVRKPALRQIAQGAVNPLTGKAKKPRSIAEMGTVNWRMALIIGENLPRDLRDKAVLNAVFGKVNHAFNRNPEAFRNTFVARKIDVVGGNERAGDRKAALEYFMEHPTAVETNIERKSSGEVFAWKKEVSKVKMDSRGKPFVEWKLICEEV